MTGPSPGHINPPAKRPRRTGGTGGGADDNLTAHQKTGPSRPGHVNLPAKRPRRTGGTGGGGADDNNPTAHQKPFLRTSGRTPRPENSRPAPGLAPATEKVLKSLETQVVFHFYIFRMNVLT